MKKLFLIINVAIIILGMANESWALTCTFTESGTTTDGNTTYSLSVTGTGTSNTFDTSSCNGQLPTDVSSWSGIKSKITSVSFDNSITAIGYGAFDGATSLQSANLPNVTEIGFVAFRNATSLQSANLPNVATISSYAFQNTYALQSLDLPKVTSIGEFAFNAARSLQSVNMQNIDVIGNNALSHTALESVNMPNATNVGMSAFNSSSKLRDIIISDEIKTDYWNDNAFGNLAPGAKIRCLGDINTCKDKLSKYGDSIVSRVQGATINQCKGKYVWNETQSSCDHMTENQCNDYRDENGQRLYYYNGITCSDFPKNGRISCSSNYKINNGYCWRVRYTPAEIAELVGESNTILLYYK